MNKLSLSFCHQCSNQTTENEFSNRHYSQQNGNSFNTGSCWSLLRGGLNLLCALWRDSPRKIPKLLVCNVRPVSISWFSYWYLSSLYHRVSLRVWTRDVSSGIWTSTCQFHGKADVLNPGSLLVVEVFGPTVDVVVVMAEALVTDIGALIVPVTEVWPWFSLIL